MPTSGRQARRPCACIIALAVAALVISTAPTLASITVPMKLVNDGAESGDLIGWTPSSNVFQAVNNPSVARKGDWYFEASAPSPNYESSLRQLIDLRAYHGLIEDIVLDVAMATDGGTAADSASGRAGILRYVASSGMTLFDAEGNLIPYGAGAFIQGDVHPSWVDRHTSLRLLDQMHPGLLQSVGFVEIYLDGLWWDMARNAPFDGEPSSVVTANLPSAVRFDDVRLYVTIPEPASAAYLLAAGLCLTLGRKRV